MNVLLKKDGELQETNYLRINARDCEFRISESNEGGLVITKVDFDSKQISVYPCAANQIRIE